MEKRVKLSKTRTRLWTREKAVPIREDLEAKLAELPDGGLLIIDCSTVEVFDYSFANELFGKLLHGIVGRFPGRSVVVEHLTPYVRENLIQALVTMNLAMIERTDGGPRLIGKVAPTDERTFQVAVNAGRPITAAEMTKKMDVNVTAMNERLTKLAQLGVLRRERSTSERGREQYSYSVLA